MDGVSLVGYSPWGCKESDTTEQLHFFTSKNEGKHRRSLRGRDKPEEGGMSGDEIG